MLKKVSFVIGCSNAGCKFYIMLIPDVDECAELIDNCTGVATCKNELGSFICKCPTGYTLDENDPSSCNGQYEMHT